MSKLDELKNELAEKWWLSESLSGTYDYDLEWVFKQGFDAADAHYRPIVQELIEALELAEKELFRFNCEAPIELTAIEKPVYLTARQALESVKNKI